MRSFVVAGLALAATTLYADDNEKKKGEISFRAIVRAGVSSNGETSNEFVEKTNAKKATSLNYKVLLLDESGKEKAVNATTTTFKPGDRFKLSIETDTDLYIYVIYEGPDGGRTVLLPDANDKGHVPMAKRDDKTVVPDDGTYFEFVPPPGEEKLIVFGSREKRSEFNPVEFENADTQKQIKLKQIQDQAIREALPQLHVLPTEQEAKAEEVASTPTANTGFAFRGVFNLNEKTGSGGISYKEDDGSKTVLRTSTDGNAPPVAVEISLKSARAQQ